MISWRDGTYRLICSRCIFTHGTSLKWTRSHRKGDKEDEIYVSPRQDKTKYGHKGEGVYIETEDNMIFDRDCVLGRFFFEVPLWTSPTYQLIWLILTVGNKDGGGSATCGTSSTPLLTFRTSYECTLPAVGGVGPLQEEDSIRCHQDCVEDVPLANTGTVWGGASLYGTTYVIKQIGDVGNWRSDPWSPGPSIYYIKKKINFEVNSLGRP